MTMTFFSCGPIILIAIIPIFIGSAIFTQQQEQQIKKSTLDRQVQSFLDSRRGTWHDMNVPEADGKLLYDLIIKNKYKNALEIGTSTGHSSIWIAWALSQTGGKLITIEINEERHRQAVANFRAAGLAEFIDARLADAHQLVKELKGPFDFVFSDADKEWYTNYFIDISPKMEVGGCFTAHNVSGKTRSEFGFSGTAEYYNYIKKLPGWDTTVDNRGTGISMSYKRSP